MKYNRGKWRSASALVLGIALLASCSIDNQKDQGDRQSVRIALDWSTYVAYHAPFVVAEEEGFFSEEGVNPTFSLTGGSKDAVLATGTDQADISFADLSTTAASILSGIPVKSVAVIQDKNASGFIGTDGVKLDSAADFKGLRIGSTPGGSDSTLIPAFLSSNDLSAEDVEIVNLPANGKLSALITGDVDVVSGQVYYYEEILKSQGKTPNSKLYADLGVDVLDHGFVASDDFINANPGTVKKFLAAYNRGLQKSIDDPSSACDKVADRSVGTMTVESCLEQLQSWLTLVTDPTASNWGMNDDPSWISTVDILKTYGGVQGDADPAQMYTNDLVPVVTIR